MNMRYAQNWQNPSSALISADSLARAIPMGVAKVDSGTYLKQSYLRAVRKAL